MEKKEDLGRFKKTRLIAVDDDGVVVSTFSVDGPEGVFSFPKDNQVFDISNHELANSVDIFEFAVSEGKLEKQPAEKVREYRDKLKEEKAQTPSK